ncbi:hypothetical protein QFC24_005095 [Naganishia onofrii]|uniref:Uncharacterized protein n=1 Tax=Naganishia onofrii TaxID=1851511 RepID=A0ACC2XBU3_9TREE|nr:hypothetical protein QFC24_005095 [Naganishia onofrii]
MSRPSRNPTAFLPSPDPSQMQLQHALEEMSRQKGIVDSMQNGLRVYEAFTQALKKENEAYVVEIAKLKTKVKDLSKRRDGESTLTEPMTEENFLGHEDTNPKDFVNRLVDKITDICLSKAEQSNWDGPDLLNRIMQDRRLVKERKDNPWCNYLEYKAYKERVAYVDEDTCKSLTLLAILTPFTNYRIPPLLSSTSALRVRLSVQLSFCYMLYTR